MTVTHNKIFFSGWNNLYSVPSDFTVDTVATLIPFPNEKPMDGYQGGYWNFMTKHSDTSVYLEYGMVGYMQPPRDVSGSPTMFGASHDKSTHTVHSYIYKIDPHTSHITDRIKVMSEEGFTLCKNGGVSPDDSWGYYICSNIGVEGLQAGSRIFGEQSFMKFRLTSNPIKVVTRVELNPTEVVAEATYSDPLYKSDVQNNAYRSILNPTGLSVASFDNSVHHVKVNATQNAMLHFDEDGGNVYLGSAIAAMGRQKRDEWTSRDNVVIGTHSANLKYGSNRNIIIGNRLLNEYNSYTGNTGTPTGELKNEKYYELAHKLFTTDLTKRMDATMPPKEGVFQIGFDANPLISGNFDTHTLNIPPLEFLNDVKVKVDANVNANMKNVLFTRYNIVQTVNNGNAQDGVQELLNRLSSLDEKMCVVQARLDGVSSSQCKAAKGNTITSFSFRYDSLYSETSFIVKYRQYETMPWTNLITFNSKVDSLVINSFNINNKIDEQKAMITMKGDLPDGFYHISHADAYGDGFQTSGVPYESNVDPIFSLTVGGVTISRTTSDRWTTGAENAFDKNVFFQLPEGNIAPSPPSSA